MTHTYILSGLTCNGCVAKVKNQLLKHADILSVDVTLNPQRAVIHMSKHINTNDLQKTIGSGYTILEKSSPLDHSVAASETSWLETYKPLLLIFAFITLVSSLVSYHHSSFHGMQFMNVFMAGFFLVFSFFKLLDLKGFASSYTMYDIVAKRIPVYGYIYPFIELGLGILYLTNFDPTFTNWSTIIVMGVSSIGVIESVLSKKKIQCACLGAVFNLPMSTVTIIEDLLMVGMAVAMLFQL
jgi:copper chaperone CopZ